MRTKILMLLISFIGMCIYGTRVEGKTLGENRDEILWGTDPIPRSIFPLRGYVENSIVTLCFYDNPSSATITIADTAATPIYKEVVTDASIVNIDLGDRTGEFAIKVEYNSMVFYGTFSLD